MKRIQQNQLVHYASPLFSPQVVHGFSTKLGGVSQGDFQSLNLISSRGDNPQTVAENYRLFAQAIGFSGKTYARNNQVHGDTIRLVTTGENLDHFTNPQATFPSGDGLISQEKNLGLWAYSADCVAILYHDPVTKSIGACHAGWRGTAQGIARKMVTEMTAHFGTNPADLQVSLGPSIQSCCFSCHDDVADAMTAQLGDKILPFCQQDAQGKWNIHLQGINGLLLEESGVTQVDIDVPCTACHPDEFWSHRKQGDKRGSMGGMIALKGDLS